ncbi:hypothetical protein HDU91_002488 [Kappamyces sp. JEL0680]|nr:hypothetical protein HDU91_002488 [Kappamyces sp. JEL0680]
MYGLELSLEDQRELDSWVFASQAVFAYPLAFPASLPISDAIQRLLDFSRQNHPGLAGFIQYINGGAALSACSLAARNEWYSVVCSTMMAQDLPVAMSAWKNISPLRCSIEKQHLLFRLIFCALETNEALAKHLIVNHLFTIHLSRARVQGLLQKLKELLERRNSPLLARYTEFVAKVCGPLASELV